MAQKILVALDSSEGAWRAVAYVAEAWGKTPEVQVTLLHVLSGLPPAFWDDGHILDQEEREARQRVINKWLENQKLATEPMFRNAVELLKQKGIQPERIQTKTLYDSTDVAKSILEEARDGGYLTLVLGRCGFSRVGEMFLGSTTSRIINQGAGLAICVVE